SMVKAMLQDEQQKQSTRYRHDHKSMEEMLLADLNDILLRGDDGDGNNNEDKDLEKKELEEIRAWIKEWSHEHDEQGNEDIHIDGGESDDIELTQENQDGNEEDELREETEEDIHQDQNEGNASDE